MKFSNTLLLGLVLIFAVLIISDAKPAPGWFYGSYENDDGPIHLSTGIYRGVGRVDSDESWNGEVGTIGVDWSVPVAPMIRARAIDANVEHDTGPYVGGGLGWDTGIAADSGVELKVAGSGAKIGTDESHLCLFNMCLGWKYG